MRLLLLVGAAAGGQDVCTDGCDAPAHVSSSRCFEWIPEGAALHGRDQPLLPPDTDWVWPPREAVCADDALASVGLCRTNGTAGWRLGRVVEAAGCRFRWRWIAADVVPPVPPAAVLLNAAQPPQSRSGVCSVDGAVGALAFGGRLGGVCSLPNGTFSPGPYKILLAEASWERQAGDCGGEAAAGELRRRLQRLVQHLRPEDQKNIEDTTGYPFKDLLSSLGDSNACVLQNALSHARFVPGAELNLKGLHLLRAVLAERLTEARRVSTGYDAHPDHAAWSRDGFVVKDYDELVSEGDGKLRTLLEMAAAGDSVQDDLSFVSRAVVHHPADTQYQLHVDTFHTAVKMWVYDSNLTKDDGPLRFVRGSHRNTMAKLRWMYEMTGTPRADVETEPSLRLGSENPDARGFEAEMAMVPGEILPGARRMLIVADTSALHRRGVATPGTVRMSLRPAAAEADGGVRRRDPFRAPDASTRLWGCNTDCGRVEVRRLGRWGGVSAAGWGMAEAGVTCRELGFESAVSAYAFFDRSPTTAWHGVNCTGSELRLADCPRSADAAPPDGAHAAVSCRAGAATPSARADLDPFTASLKDAALRAAAAEPEVGAGAGCDEWPPGVPSLPLSTASVRQAYTHADLAEPLLAEAAAAVRRSVCAGAGEPLRQAFDAGARWTAAGMQLQVPPNGGLRAALSADSHAPIHWDFDAAVRWAVPPEAGSIARDLAEDGVALIDDWGLPADDVDSLFSSAAQQVAAPDPNLTSVASGGAVYTTRMRLPALDRLLAGGAVREAVRGYLGDSVTLSGYKLTTLSGALASQEQYVASKWHHDRVGRRLKMFVFLHDVQCSTGRATLVAKGTHRIHYWRTESFAVSRFKDGWVRRHWPVVEACGRKGGGFIFDTHTIHRAGTAGDGSPERGADRTTAVIEFHNSAKCDVVTSLGYPLPCPSGDQFMLGSRV